MTSSATKPIPSWDFTPVYDLFESLCLPEAQILKDNGLNCHSFSTPQRLPSPSQFDPKVKVPKNLGDFNRLFEYINLPIETLSPGSRRGSIDSTISSSDHEDASPESAESTPPSSLPDAILFDHFVDRKVRWTDEIEGSSELETPKSNSSKRSRKLRLVSDSAHVRNTADFDSETDNEAVRRHESVRRFIPPWVTLPSPKKLPEILQSQLSNRQDIYPIETLTPREKDDKLINKLKVFLTYGPIFGSDRQLHIFVDCSNIVIGFYNVLKLQRGIHIKSPLKAPLSWHALATILERGRPVARRVLAGSTGATEKQPYLPAYVQEAQLLGYECNIMDRVFKYKEATPTKGRRRGGNGYATNSGYSSGSEATPSRSRVMTEQGVDELLHMKMLESIVDTTRPGTIVLASGDAAEAEYSGGFYKNVERALLRGWHVEIVSWRAGLSREYLNAAFLEKWRGKFRVTILDEFSEDLLGLYTTPVRL